ERPHRAHARPDRGLRGRGRRRLVRTWRDRGDRRDRRGSLLWRRYAGGGHARLSPAERAARSHDRLRGASVRRAAYKRGLGRSEIGTLAVLVLVFGAAPT